MRPNPRNRAAEALEMTQISNGWEYIAAGGADDDDGDADAAAAEAAAKARGDVVDDTDDADEEAKKVAEAAEKAKIEAEEAAKAAKTADEESEEDETVETAEEKAAREAEEAEEEKKRRIRVPKWRLDEIAEKARKREETLLAQIAALQKKDEPEKKDVLGEMRTQITTLQDKYEDHVFKGEKDEAKKVRQELDTLRDRYTDAKVAASGAATRAQTIDTLKYEAALAKVEADYPALNPDNGDQYDEAKSTEVAELLEMFMGRGMTRQASLEKAVKYVMGAPAAKKEAAKDDTAETLRKKREQDARQAAVEANKRQPPNAQVAGKDNDKAGTPEQGIDIMKLSQERFAKLDEDTLAKLRGDAVT